MQILNNQILGQMIKKDTTLREKAAIFALAAGYLKTWQQCYIAAYPNTENDAENLRSLPSIVTRWKNVPVISAEYERARKYLQNRDLDTEDKVRAELRQEKEETGGSVRTKSAPEKRAFVDFSRPENQTAKLNELVNTADDTGEALDALKVIIATQKADREVAKEGRVVRAYLPVSCTDCPLYERARKQRL